MKPLDSEERKRLELGRRVRELRDKKKMSGAELAAACNVSRGYIGDIESGRVNPSLDVLRRLADALETTVSYLLGEEDGPNWTREAEGLIVHLRGPFLDELTDEERQTIVNFIKFVRSQKKRPAKGE